MGTLGSILLAAWVVAFGALVAVWMFGLVTGPRRARRLIDTLMSSDHDDWWDFLTGGHVVGGSPRPTFAFRVLSGGRTSRAAGVCAFDDQMFICISVDPLPWAPDRRSPGRAWLKEHARFRVEHRFGGDVLVEGSDRARYRLWGIRIDALVPEMEGAGWVVEVAESYAR